jgi:polysaccharide export outer membrane protein
MLLPLCWAAASCAGAQIGRNLPNGTQAYNVIPAANPEKAKEDYRIGPLDALDITVFQEPELSVKAVKVDAFGNVALPLVGSVSAGGKTANQLSSEIAASLGKKYLENPQVSVVVSTPVAQKVVVQGEVVQPGVYQIEGPTTLLGALALAKGETRVASLDQVVVFRTVNGQRMGAVFDISSIRSGTAKDPEIVSNDLIVVGNSPIRSLWRDVLSAAPLLNVFRPY